MIAFDSVAVANLKYWQKWMLMSLHSPTNIWRVTVHSYTGSKAGPSQQPTTCEFSGTLFWQGEKGKTIKIYKISFASRRPYKNLQRQAKGLASWRAPVFNHNSCGKGLASPLLGHTADTTRPFVELACWLEPERHPATFMFTAPQ